MNIRGTPISRNITISHSYAIFDVQLAPFFGEFTHHISDFYSDSTLPLPRYLWIVAGESRRLAGDSDSLRMPRLLNGGKHSVE